MQFSDVATRYPPSLRIVVQETNLLKLRAGELFIITYKGGSLGREGSHDVIIPDINVSKVCLCYFTARDHIFIILRCSIIWNSPTTKLSLNTNASIWDHATELFWTVTEWRVQNKKANPWPLYTVQTFSCPRQSYYFIFTTATLPVMTVNLVCCCTMVLVALLRVRQRSLPQSRSLLTSKNWKWLRNVMALPMRVSSIEFLTACSFLLITSISSEYLIQQSTNNDRAAQRRKEVGSSDKSEKTEMASLET